MNLGLADPRTAPWVAAAASVALFFSPWVVGILGAFASLLSPAPLVLLYRRQGLKAGRTAAVLAIVGAVLTALIIGEALNAVFFVFYLAVATGLGEAPFWGLAEHQALGAGAVAGMVTLLALGLMIGAMAGGMGNAWDSYWSLETQAVGGLYQEAGMDPVQLENLREFLKVAGRVISSMGVGLLASGALVLAWANLIVVRSFWPTGQPTAALNTWRSPDFLVWAAIAGGAMMVLADGFWFWVGCNAVLVLGVLYFFQGIAVLAFWLEKKNTPRLVRVLIYLVLAVDLYLAVFIALAGLFDLWFNFRRLGKEPEA